MSLPQTGFTPGTHTSLAVEPDGYYDTGNDLTIEIPPSA